MSQKKETPAANTLLRTWLALSVRRLVGIMAWTGVTVGLLSAVVLGLWRHVQGHVESGVHYRLDPRLITLQPAPPAYIRSDIRAEVLKSASLDDNGPWSILDPDLAERLYKSFALHPWVAKVSRVVKQNPAGVQVQLVYRKPVCMVEVPGGLYAVDAEAYLLPSADFTPADAKRFPRLAGVQTVTEGPVGTPWQDAHVRDAANLAAVLFEVWPELGLARIAPTPGEWRLAPQAQEYDLFTAQQSCVRWGTVDDSHSSTGQPAASEKTRRLREFVKLHGSLDGSVGPQLIDLRHRELTVQPLAVSATSVSPPVVPVSRHQGTKAILPE